MESRTKRSTTEKDYRERKRVKVKTTISNPNSNADNNNKNNNREDVNIQLVQLLKEIKELKDPKDDEYLLSSLFMDQPSKKHYPDYYKVIKQPIALTDMENKADKKKYQSIDQFKADIALMVSNANTYNEPDSQVSNDALYIQKYVDAWKPKREKTVLKLPGEAFNAKTIKAIKLKAVDKHKPSANMLALMQFIDKKEYKKAVDIFEKDKQLDPNELVETEMFGDKFTWAPIHAAAYYNHVKLMPHLMERKGNVELHDTWHSATPLGWAAFGDRDKMAKLLIQKYHANVMAKNKHGQVPYDVVSNPKDEKWKGLFVKTVSPTQIHIHKPTNTLKLPVATIKPTTTHNDISLKPTTTTTTTTITTKIKTTPLSNTDMNGSNIPTTTTTNTIDVATAGLNASTIPIAPASAKATIPDTDSSLPPLKKRRGRPPKSETEAQDIRPTEEIDINTFDPVAFEIELFNAIRTHTDNTSRLYSELFEDLPDRTDYPDYYKTIPHPRSLSDIAEKMSTRQYPNLQHWITDMQLVFDNALSYNEPGSRIFRDAKLLKRLLHRLKERILARLLVPVSQEEEVMQLDLLARPFDAYLLSEDKRKSKKVAKPAMTIAATTSIEPVVSLPPDMMVPIATDMVVPPPMFDPALLVQSNPMMLAAMMNNPDIMNLAATAAAASAAASADPSTKHTPLSDESYKLIKEQGRFLDSLQLSSDSFQLSIDCHLVGHSVTVPGDIETITITPHLPNDDERHRFSIMIFHNNIQLNPQQDHTWITTPLVRGMNVIKVSVTVNLTQPDSTLPDFKSQLYHVFVQQTW